MEIKVPLPIPEEDLLRGADQVAAFLFGSDRHRRKVYHLMQAKQNRPPIVKIGSLVYARKSKIMAWLEDQENGGNDDAKK